MTLQNYLADATQKAATDLETALNRVPQDKRNWKPQESSRSALDQIAECAILNGASADVIENKIFPDFDFPNFQSEKDKLAADENAALELLRQNAARVATAIRAVKDEDLEQKIAMPWGEMTLAQNIAYPNWNMTYHEGQINYIASLLDCLK